MAKISSRTSLTSVDKSDVLGIYRPGVPNVSYKIAVSDLLAGAVQPVSDPATPNGVDDQTTARLIYGINVVRAASTSNFCFRLPATPQKGKCVTIINTSSQTVRVFPSVTGGSLNGVVNGSIDIAPNSRAYQIYCYENPNPGDWSTPLSQQSTVLTFGTFSINHTSGVQDVAHGINAGAAVSGGLGGGTDGSGNLVLSPTSADWRTENGPATAIKMRVYTNIVANDCPEDFNAGVNGIMIWRETAYKTGPSGSTIGQRETATFLKTGDPFQINDSFGIVTGGPLSSPAEIGDAGTFYAEVLAPVNIGNQIGTGGQYSNYWYTFGFQVASLAATKNYKFRIELEYV